MLFPLCAISMYQENGTFASLKVSEQLGTSVRLNKAYVYAR